MKGKCGLQLPPARGFESGGTRCGILDGKLFVWMAWFGAEKILPIAVVVVEFEKKHPSWPIILLPDQNYKSLIDRSMTINHCVIACSRSIPLCTDCASASG